MQILESSVIGLRSAFFRLEADDHTPCFSLFPMLHIADPEFYEEVSRRLACYDLILYEGVNSRIAPFLTASYRYFASNPRLGLVEQRTMKLDHIENRMIHADVSGEDFDKRWSRLSIFWRTLITVGAPLYGLYMRFFGTRADILRNSSLTLLKSPKEILVDDEKLQDIYEILLDWRDRHLINIIEQQRKKHPSKSVSIAIVYGAQHMRAVIYHLTRRPKPGYSIVKAQWMTVIHP